MLAFEASKQVNIALDLHERNVKRFGLEYAKRQLAIGFTWLDGHAVDEDTECIRAADLLHKLGGQVSYGCAPANTYVEIVEGKFRVETR